MKLLSILALILISTPVFAAKDSATFIANKSSLAACWDASITPSVGYNLYVDGGRVNSKPILKTCFTVNINTKSWLNKNKNIYVKSVDSLNIESIKSNVIVFRYEQKTQEIVKEKPKPVTNLRFN